MTPYKRCGPCSLALPVSKRSRRVKDFFQDATQYQRKSANEEDNDRVEETFRSVSRSQSAIKDDHLVEGDVDFCMNDGHLVEETWESQDDIKDNHLVDETWGSCINQWQGAVDFCIEDDDLVEETRGSCVSRSQGAVDFCIKDDEETWESYVSRSQSGVDFCIKDDHLIEETKGLCFSISQGAVDFCIKDDQVEFEERRGSYFDFLPLEIVVIILTKLAASADCAFDFVNVLATCRNLHSVGGDSDVLAHASSRVFAIGIHQWCESAHRFFNRCVEAGNAEASYSLGMIQFYCLENRRIGLSLLEKSAERSHPQSLYSLAVIHFNGSGEPSKEGKDLRLAAELCSRAAALHNVDALRELGHCFLDGYGVEMDEHKGQKLLTEASMQELRISSALTAGKRIVDVDYYICLPSYFYAVAHPVNRFLRDWWEDKLRTKDATEDGVARLCSNGICGRVETRKHEFRRCSVCSIVNYCSKACQEIDWNAHHKAMCLPTALYLMELNPEAFFF